MSDEIRESVVVNRNAADVFSMWENLENLPRFMKNIHSVQSTGATTSHWVMNNPGGEDFEWDAEIADLVQGKRIAWRSIGGDVDNEGEVVLRPLSDSETEVTVAIRYGIPAGVAAEVMARFSDYPAQVLRSDLEGFKRYAEQGR